ncbi:MAG: hypothetical protein V1899_02935 [Planctomycetota bacterium]
MEIIRDNELGGVMMIPLFVDWQIRRCNVKGCRAVPTTIIAGHDEAGRAYGLCEVHFQQGNQPEGANLTIEFDAFDAFKSERSGW